MIVHTLKMCTSGAGLEQSLVLFQYDMECVLVCLKHHVVGSTLHLVAKFLSVVSA